MKTLLLYSLSIISLFVVSSTIGDEGAGTRATLKEPTSSDSMYMEEVVDNGRPVDASDTSPDPSDALLDKDSAENQPVLEMNQDGNKLGMDTSGRHAEEPRTMETDGGYCVTARQDGSGVTGDDCKTAPFSGLKGGQHITQEGPDIQLGMDKTEIEEKLERYDVMVEWVKSHGGFWQHQAFQYLPGAGMGVISSEDIEVK